MSSFLRRMMMAAAMRKDGNLMGEEFCDADGKAIVTTLADKSVLCWQQMAKDIKEWKVAKYNEGGYITKDAYVNFAGTAVSIKIGHRYIAKAKESDGDNATHGLMYILGSGDVQKWRYNTICNSEITDYNVIFDSNEEYDGNFGTYWSCAKVYNANLLDITMMFKHCNILPSSVEQLYTFIHSEGSTTLGYTPYTSTPTPVVVSKGKLHYALTKEVRDYAASFSTTDNDVLAKLNEYCCEHPAMIEYINKWKYIIHSLGLGTGYTSWLKGDGSAYIDTGYFIQSSAFEVSAKVKFSELTHNQDFLGNGTWSQKNGLYVGVPASSEQKYFVKAFNSANSPYVEIDGRQANVVQDIIYKKRSFTLNGVESVADKLNFHDDYIPNQSLCVFGVKASNVKPCDDKTYISNIAFTDVEKSASFLPYYDSKTKKFGMLDVAADTPKFYGAEPNTGEFTWSLTDEYGIEIANKDEEYGNAQYSKTYTANGLYRRFDVGLVDGQKYKICITSTIDKAGLELDLCREASASAIKQVLANGLSVEKGKIYEYEFISSAEYKADYFYVRFYPISSNSNELDLWDCWVRKRK